MTYNAASLDSAPRTESDWLEPRASAPETVLDRINDERWQARRRRRLLVAGRHILATALTTTIAANAAARPESTTPTSPPAEVR